MVEQVFGEVVVTTPSRQAIRRHHHQRIAGFGQWLWEKAGFGHGAGGVDIAAVFQEKVNDLEAAVASGAATDIEDYYINRAKPIPLGRVGEGREAGDLIAFLASDRASYISGTAINMDGGAAPVV